MVSSSLSRFVARCCLSCVGRTGVSRWGSSNESDTGLLLWATFALSDRRPGIVMLAGTGGFGNWPITMSWFDSGSLPFSIAIFGLGAGRFDLDSLPFSTAGVCSVVVLVAGVIEHVFATDCKVGMTEVGASCHLLCSSTAVRFASCTHSCFRGLHSGSFRRSTDDPNL